MADQLTGPGRMTPKAMLAGAVLVMVLAIGLALAAVSGLSSPEGPEPVTMAPAAVPVDQRPAPPRPGAQRPVVAQPDRVGAPRPVEPKAAGRVPAAGAPSVTRAPAAAKVTPKHTPAQDPSGQAYENGMEMARHAAGGAPWSGFVP